MVAFTLRRIALAISMVGAVSLGAFVAFGLSFDPTYQYNLCTTDTCRSERQRLIDQFHLHDPVLERYWLWLRGLPTHGFGRAVLAPPYAFDNRIGPPLWHAAAVTAQLVAVSLVLVFVLSVLVGVVSARRPGSILDGALRLFAYVAWSVPAFVVAVLVARWLAPTHWFLGGTPGGGFVRWVRQMTLPALTLSVGLVGVYSRYVRSAMVVALRQPYAVVARAKGLPERRVVLLHALRNSLIPFVSVVSLEFASVVGASLAVDWVFGMNGLAALFLRSIGQADPFAMTAILVVIGGIVAVFMLLTDLVVGWLDPRARIAAADR
jgi:ABC-type dipeptide/oligopeptide/nickel transport system permease component